MLADLSFYIAPGERVALVGANGSGKTTLARVLAGLQLPSEGEMSWQAVRTGLVLQDPESQFVGETLEDDIAFGLENQALPRPVMVDTVERVLARFDLASLRSRSPYSLSGGQQQRAAVAATVAYGAELVVFDEPTSQLDAEHRASIRALAGELAADGGAVVWITQDLEELGLVERVIALHRGRLAFDGHPSQLISDRSLLEWLDLEAPAATRLALGLLQRGVPLHSVPLDQRQLHELLGEATR